jgi:glycosyltransferase involved in cell wall biosynthesis
MNPDFSIAVIVTHFNRVDMCLRCLQSILDQTQKPTQVILIDDASTQPIESLVQFCEDNGCDFIQNDQNSFVGHCREKALAIVSASHVVFIDDDDWFYPTAFRSFLHTVQQNPNEPHSFLLDVLHEDGSLTRQHRPHSGRSTNINDFLESLVSIHATLVPASFYKTVHFENSLRYYVDISIWLQMHCKTGVWNYHNETIGVYNRSGQASITKVSVKNYHARINTFRYFIQNFSSEEILIWSHKKLIEAFFCLGADSVEGPTSILELLKSHSFLMRKRHFTHSKLVVITIPKMLLRLLKVM